MPRKKSSLLTELSTADLKRLLAARERIDVLEKEKGGLVKELAKIEKELGKLMNEAAGARTGAVKKVRRKKVAKKTAKKAPRKTAKKTVRKKVVRKKVVRKKVVRKKVVRKKVLRKKTAARKAPGKKSTAAKSKGAGKMKLEDVIVSVIRKNGSSIAFQDLKTRILKGKLFKTKSGNFDNVLRRTLSTSKKVKRVGRGIYDVA
jgi:hypothetical protein